MTAWARAELDKVGATEELEIAPVRNGITGKFVTIWVVRVDDELYVRSVNGRSSNWFRAVLRHHQGRIRADGVEKDVKLLEDDSDRNDEIDASYRAKYRRYAARIVDSIVSPKARSATLRLQPS